MALLPWLAGGAVVVAMAAGWMAFTGKRVPVTNRLLLPVQLHVEREPLRQSCPALLGELRWDLPLSLRNAGCDPVPDAE